MKVELCRDKDWLLSEEAFAIYSQCMYQATYEDYKAQMTGYLSDSSVRIFVCESRGRKEGILVLDHSDVVAEIVGIAVNGRAHRKGIGSRLIQGVMDSENLKSIKAQTDDDAIGFYRKCGFAEEREVIEYPDGAAVRYNCIKCGNRGRKMIGLIVARSKNNVIGKGGEIPWRIKGEQKQFKELTTGNVVVMGRRSYEEIGHPLPNRTTIVVSRTKQFEGEGVWTAGSVREAIEIAGDKDVFIAGGYGLYKEALPFVDVMYITEVDLVIEDGDVYFPEFNEEEFEKTIGETLGDDIRYTRTVYRRKSF